MITLCFNYHDNCPLLIIKNDKKIKLILLGKAQSVECQSTVHPGKEIPWL